MDKEKQVEDYYRLLGESVNLKIKGQREATDIYLRSKLRFGQRPLGEGKDFFMRKKKGNNYKKYEEVISTGADKSFFSNTWLFTDSKEHP